MLMAAPGSLSPGTWYMGCDAPFMGMGADCAAGSRLYKRDNLHWNLTLAMEQQLEG